MADFEANLRRSAGLAWVYAAVSARTVSTSLETSTA
jgi:hypothetical protein